MTIDLSRRAFILFGHAVAALPLTARAQQRRQVPTVGVLWHAANEEQEAPYPSALRQGFVEHGYDVGRTLMIENRFAAEEYERFESNAAELVARKVDALIAVTRPAAVAAQRATSEIPIVFVVVPDPVGLGIVASLAHPGGNITGLTHVATDIVAKRIEIFRELVPGLSRLVLLVNPNDPVVMHRNIDEAQSAARHFNIVIQPVEVRTPQDFDRAFTVIAQTHVDGIVTGIDPMISNEKKQIAQLAMRQGLPTMLHHSEMAKVGGLMSYGPNFPGLFRRAADYVDMILRGTKPGDLPVEQPTKFELVINLKTAKALGIKVPPLLLTRADEVIE
jgi:putative tryptophan/tyrosine transport system substrate-binding protein